jgi:hypothetical protein
MIMYRKLEIRTAFLVILLTLSIVFLGTLTPTKAATTTVVYVDPSEVKDIFSPSTFTISVKVANVTNLYGIDIQFAWDPTIIKYVSHAKRIPVETYADGILHKNTIPVLDQVDENASMPGSEPGTMYWLSEASLAPAKSFNGSGTIFTMKFQVVGLGSSPLRIVACTLADKGGLPIAYTAINGDFVNYVAPPTPPADILVHPSSIVNSSLTPSSNFSLSTDVKKIENLYSYDFALAYNGTLLEVAQVTGNPAFPTPTVTEGTGHVRVSSSLVSPSSPISGNFSLATIKFHVLAVGETDIDLHDVILKDDSSENITFNEPGDGFFTNSAVFAIAATVDVKTDGLNLKSIGRWFTVYVELPEGYDVNGIDISTVKLNGTISANALASTQVGDYDGDGVDDLLVKFNRTQVIAFVSIGHTGSFNITATFVVTGNLETGISFEGSDVAKTSNLLGDVNGDGKVDILDLVLGAFSYNSTDDGLLWNPNANFVNFAPSYNRIEILDLVTIVSQYGKSLK